MFNFRKSTRKSAQRRHRKPFASLSMEPLETRRLMCGDVAVGIDVFETPRLDFDTQPIEIARDLLIELDAENSGRSVDPLSNPELFPELHRQHREQQGGSVGPLNSPELFPELDPEAVDRFFAEQGAHTNR